MNKKKILVVDDEVDLTMLMEHMLLSTGLYDVVVAHDGMEAQKKFIDEKPDLVFLDFIMPEVRGDEVLKFIRAHSKVDDVDVVVMSGLGGEVYLEDQKDKEQMFQSEIDANIDKLSGEEYTIAFPYELMEKYHVAEVLPKPFTGKQLKELAARMLNPETQE